MDKVLVTGGTGFVGHWMQWTELESVGEAFYMSHRSYDEVMWGGEQWDYVVHLAPIAPAGVIEYCKWSNARLLYCSSGIVYHPEHDTEYRQNKIKWEQECLDSGVDVVIARLFTFCGERLDDGKAIVQFEKAAKAGQPLRIWGDGSCVRSYMHGSELGKWIWAILLHGERGEAYDVGSDEPVTMLELALKIAEPYQGLFPYRHEPRVVVENSQPDPMPVYLPTDTAKTKRLLDG